MDVSPGASITIRLADQADVNSWSIQCATTDETNDADAINAALVIDSATKTAVFASPGRGGTLRFHSVVNEGLDANGVADDDLETTFCIYIPTAVGRRVLAADETTEGHPHFGWVTPLNRAIRDSASASTSDATPTLARRYPMADGDVRLIRALVKAQSADGSGAVRGEWDIRAAYRRIAGTLAQEYAPVITTVFAVGAPGGPSLTLNGDTDVDLNVTGERAMTDPKLDAQLRCVSR